MFKLIKFDDSGFPQPEINADYTKSSVETICLLDCAANTQAVMELFRWPQSLKTISIEVHQGSSLSHSISHLLEALNLHRGSLEHLTSTRTEQPTDLGYSEPVDMSQFTSLRTLSSLRNYVIIDFELHTRLPESLEELHIFYDDPRCWDLLQLQLNWVRTLLQFKLTI